ncbi:MAG: heme ABC exporter ATP-binding protein CcmA [Chloroflexota bacterium]
MAILETQPLAAANVVVGRGLTKRYGRVAALRQVDLCIAPGERVALLGPNGAGKTTLLRLLSTLARPTSGQLLVHGYDARRQAGVIRGLVSLVGHRPSLYDDLTAAENLRFRGRLHGVADLQAQARAALGLVGLAERSNQPAGTLSRGQQQRLAIAQALLTDPTLLLLDEPDTGLDASGRAVLEQLLDPASGRTIVFSTHDREWAERVASRTITLRDGRVAAEATPLGARPARAETGREHLPVKAAQPALLAPIGAIVARELLSEYRRRDTLVSLVVFSLLVLLVFDFAFDVRTVDVPLLGPGLLWVTFIFAGVLAFNRSFSLEEDRGTLAGLLLAPVDRAAIYLGKLLTSCLFLLLVEAVTTAVFAGFFSPRVQPLPLIGALLLGTLGFAAVGTLFAAMSANTRAREVLLPVLLFPVAVPVLIAAVQATASAFGATASAHPWLGLIAAYDAIFLAVSFAVFDFVLEE